MASLTAMPRRPLQPKLDSRGRISANHQRQLGDSQQLAEDAQAVVAAVDPIDSRILAV